MFFKKKTTLWTALIAVLLPIAIFSCNEKECPIAPEQEIGTVIVNPSPDSIDAPWVLVGPEDYSKSDTGDHTISGLVVGNYVITWEGVSGWIAAQTDTQALVANGTITFSGIYTVSCQTRWDRIST